MFVYKLKNVEKDLLDGSLVNYFENINCNIHYTYLPNDILMIQIHLHNYSENNFSDGDFREKFKHVII